MPRAQLNLEEKSSVQMKSSEGGFSSLPTSKLTGRTERNEDCERNNHKILMAMKTKILRNMDTDLKISKNPDVVAGNGKVCINVPPKVTTVSEKGRVLLTVKGLPQIYISYVSHGVMAFPSLISHLNGRVTHFL